MLVGESARRVRQWVVLNGWREAYIWDMAVEDATALEEVSILWTDGEVECNDFG